MTEEKASPAAAQAPSASPSAGKARPQGNETASPRPKPSFHIYSRQKDQHVVGPGCWCMPKVEIVDGQKVIIHKRD